MSSYFRRRMNLFTKRVLYKEPSETSLCIGVAASIITLGTKIGMLVHQTDVSEWSTIDLAYIKTCADAMDLYVEDDEVKCIVEACHEYTAAYYLVTMTNKYVINMLSFKIHLKYEIPFVYIQQQIWARKLQNAGYRMPYFEEDVNRTLVTMTPEMAIMLIDMEFKKEDRIRALPLVPTFSSSELLRVQTCVLSLISACSKIQGDSAPPIHSEYPISSSMAVSNVEFVRYSAVQCANVHRLVAKGLACGNITIDATSAFWMYIHLPVDFSDFEILDPNTIAEMRKELSLFPEVDPEIVQKVQAMIGHPNWMCIHYEDPY